MPEATTIKAGDLDQRIAIERPIVTHTEARDPVESWELRGRRWASVEPVSAREAVAAEGAEGRIDYVVRLRLWLDVEHADRVSWRGKVLSVASALHDRTAAETRLLCVEVEA